MIFIIILVFFITILGTISGVGGGVVIKPVLDATNQYDVATISVLTTSTLLAMAFISLIRSLISKEEKISYFSAFILGIGSVIGGFGGQILLKNITENSNDNTVKLFQNIILGVITIIVFIYTTIKNKPKYEFKNRFVFFITGIVLGLIASFLGIGGGPLNVALLMLLFSVNIKDAAAYSLIIILFSQITKILTITFTSGFDGLDLSILPYMVIAGAVGAIIGAFIAKRANSKMVTILFNVMQLLIFAIVLYNIIMFI